jgi:hypothetical protein
MPAAGYLPEYAQQVSEIYQSAGGTTPGVLFLPSNRAKLPARGKRHADLIALLPGLIEVLSAECTSTDTLYLSWDAASWHSSKQLTEELARINGAAYRLEHLTPEIRLAPLPVTAQFLECHWIGV